MNKQELIELVAKEINTSKAGAARAVDAVLGGIKKGVKKDGKVPLIGFGTFTVKKRNARMGRNPLTGEQIKIKASKSVGFKAGSDFKSKL